jgi:hypothetical protein
MKTSRKRRFQANDMKLQTNDYQCGPIALVNAYIHKNKKHPPISTRRISHECSTTEMGTERWNLANNTLFQLGKPTYNTKKIMAMKAFILLYSFDTSSSHYVFVIDLDGDNFKIFNYYDVEKQMYTHTTMSRADFFEKLLCTNPKISDLDFPLAWTMDKMLPL